MEKYAIFALALGLSLAGCRSGSDQTDSPGAVPTPTPQIIIQSADPVAAVLKISPDSVGFGFVQAGKTEEKVVTLRNASGSPATNIATSVTNNTRYSLGVGSVPCGTILPAGESCQVKVIASGAGTASAFSDLIVSYHDGYVTQTFSIPMNFTSTQSGKLDPTFGTAGKVLGLSKVNDPYERVYVVKRTGSAATERLYVGGTNNTSLVRLKMDGTPDSNFGNGGVAMNPTTHSLESINLLAGGSGTIYRLGRAAGSKLFLARNNENGDVDESFDNTKSTEDESPEAKVQNKKGIVYFTGVEPSVPPGQNASLSQIIAFSFKNGTATVGKLVVAAKKSGTNAAHLMRLSSNGGGANAIEDLPVPGLENAGSNLEVLSQTIGTAKYLVVRGQEPLNSAVQGRTIIARFRDSLTLTKDTAFGTSGKIVLDRCGVGNYSAMAINANFIFLVRPGCITRLTPNGAKDATFGNGGVLAMGIDENIRSLYIRGQHIYLVGTRALNASRAVFFVVRRMLNTGLRDGSFGIDGVVEIPFDTTSNRYAGGHALDFQTDGNIVVVGNSESITDTAAGNLLGGVARILP